MRIIYVPGNERVWAQYYNSQALQHGSGFVGTPYQRGTGLGSLFKGLFRAILPIAKNVGKSVGRQALRTGTEIAGDVLAGKSIKEAAQRRGKVGASKLLNKASKNISRRPKKKQNGRGLGVRNRKKQKGRGLGVRNTKKRTTRAPATIKRVAKRGRKRVKDQLGVFYQ